MISFVKKTNFFLSIVLLLSSIFSPVYSQESSDSSMETPELLCQPGTYPAGQDYCLALTSSADSAGTGVQTQTETESVFDPQKIDP